MKRALTVEQIMRNVVLALLPISAFAVYQFGLSALLLLMTTTLVAMGTEFLFARLPGGHVVRPAIREGSL